MIYQYKTISGLFRRIQREEDCLRKYEAIKKGSLVSHWRKNFTQQQINAMLDRWAQFEKEKATELFDLKQDLISRLQNDLG